jgi:hypothetical protein
MSEKYYSEKQIYLATFFGGPIPPGILIYRNFKNLGQERRAITTLMLTFVFTILLFYGLFLIPDAISDKIPNVVFSSFYTLVVYLVYHNYFAKTINPKIAEKENKFSNGRVVAFTVMGFVINLIIIFGMAAMVPAFPGEKATYGENEIFFDKQDVSVAQLDAIAKTLYDYEYFDDQYQQSVRIEKTAEGFRMLMPLDESMWNNADVILALNNLKHDLNILLHAETEIILESYGLTETRKKQVE